MLELERKATQVVYSTSYSMMAKRMGRYYASNLIRNRAIERQAVFPSILHTFQVRPSFHSSLSRKSRDSSCAPRLLNHGRALVLYLELAAMFVRVDLRLAADFWEMHQLNDG